ncbi:MAG: alpha-E domain-containing protein [Deltaproteobacteria bacterium]|nr:MAG: alpha-E domain-containing protein [Deltaproteobacteria bacterium]
MNGLISRIAEHCFWLGRYIERAESSARMLMVTSQLALDTALEPAELWLPVVIVSGEQGPFEERFGLDQAADGELVQHYLTWDADTLVSLKQTLGAVRWNARAIRDVISLEVWETLNELHVWMGSAAARTTYEKRRYDFYRHIKRQLELVVGQLRGTMLHDDALEFILLGVLLEQAGQTARTLDVHHHAMSLLEAQTEDPLVRAMLWVALLRACSALEPFNKRRRGALQGDLVARFLLLERDFPRSVRYAVRLAHRRLVRIRPPAADALPGGQALAQLHALNTWLEDLDPASVAGAGLHAALTHVVEETASICTLLGRELFAAGAEQ